MTRLLVYGGWYGSGNIGDDAILIGIKNILSEAIPDVEIAALSTDVAQTKRVCGVDAYPLKSPRQLLLPPGQQIIDYQRCFRWADACILTGGTPIYDYDHASRIIHCGLPRILRKKLVCFGIGAKPVRSFHGKRIVRWLLSGAAAVSTRDWSSRIALRKIDPELEIRVTGDSALLIGSQSVETPAFEEPGLESLDNPVAFCPRALSPDYRAHYHAPLTHATITKTRRNIAAVADWIAEKGYDVVFIPMHQAPWDDDTAEIAEIRGMMKQPSTVASHPGSPEKAREILQKMELVLGLRLHSLILGAAAGTPIVGIDYDPKIRGFMEYAGVGDYVCGVEDSAEAVMMRIEETLDNSRSLSQTLWGNCQRMRERIRAEGQAIGEIITLSP